VWVHTCYICDLIITPRNVRPSSSWSLAHPLINERLKIQIFTMFMATKTIFKEEVKNQTWKIWPVRKYFMLQSLCCDAKYKMKRNGRGSFEQSFSTFEKVYSQQNFSLQWKFLSKNCKNWFFAFSRILLSDNLNMIGIRNEDLNTMMIRYNNAFILRCLQHALKCNQSCSFYLSLARRWWINAILTLFLHSKGKSF